MNDIEPQTTLIWCALTTRASILSRKETERTNSIRATRETFRPKVEEKRITEFVRRLVRSARAKGVVLGISGGIDSAVVAALCQRALGPASVLGVYLFEDEQKESRDYVDATKIARELKIRTLDISLTPAFEAFSRNMKSHSLKLSKLTLANIKARLRMTVLYALANERGLLVAGTDDRSESLMGYFCYDSTVRVMTPDGPKHYWELEPSSTVFSMNLETGKMEERPVDGIHVFDYDGWMIKMDNEHIDLMVTPNHRMLVSRNHGGGPLGYTNAEDLLSSRYVSIPLPRPWDGAVQSPEEIDLSTFLSGKLSSNANQPFSMKTADFLYLMGLFIGDGTVSIQKTTLTVKSALTREEYALSRRDNLGRFTNLKDPIAIEKTYKAPRIFIASSEGKRSRKPLIELLNNYKIHYSGTHTLVAFSNRALSHAFAGCGQGAKNKRIPSWVMRFPASALMHLYKGLMDSDGDASGSAYTTTSLKLAYQVVELCGKLGMYACIGWRPPRETTYRGTVIKSSGNYRVAISRHIRTVTVDGRKTGRVWYSGKIWCPSVPPHENILVERNGKSVFCGNTKYGDGGTDFLPIAHLYKSEVRALGSALRLPYEVITKPSSPNLWKGHLASQELPVDYEVLDPILTLLFDSHESVEEVSRKTGTSIAVIRKVILMNKKSQHKRELPPSLS
jgi:NH3-dependent NAD+ synthetase